MPKRKGKDRNCKCLEQANKELERIGCNTRISSCTELNFKTGKVRSTIAIATEKADPKKRESLKTVVATYCPICGKKYDAENRG